MGTLLLSEFLASPRAVRLGAATADLQSPRICGKCRKRLAYSPLAASTTEQTSFQRQQGAVARPWRAYRSPLPPIHERPTCLEQIDKSLWTLTQPFRPLLFTPTSAQNRMTVLRLSDGNLWVYNPLAPTGELLSQLADIGGRVAHVVVPNNSPEHWVHAGDFCTALESDVQLWVPPGFLTDRALPLPWLFGLKELRDSKTLSWREFGTEAPEEWGGEVELALFRSPFLMEAAFVLRGPRALLLADAAFRMDESCNPLPPEVWLTRLLGIWQRLGCPITRVVFPVFPKRARAFVQRVLDWEFDTIVPAHLASPIPEGKQAFAECFKFIL